MNIFKHIFVVGILTVSCNACGMMGFGELTKQQTSITRKKEAKLTILSQYLNAKDEQRFSELLGIGDMRTETQNREVVKLARCAYKYRRGLRKQEQERVILKSSDPSRRRTL